MIRLTKKQSAFLKLSAVLFMIIDHVGVMFFPEQEIFRIIGRAAYPLFAFQAAIACRYSKNINKYVSLLAIFTVVSQIPYSFALNTLQLNVLFTILLAVLFITNKSWTIKFSVALVAIIFNYTIHYDYGLYGFLFILIMYYVPKWYVAVGLLLALTYVLPLPLEHIQWYFIIGIVYIFIVSKIPFKKLFKKRLPSKYFFYGSYPGQFIVLKGVSEFLG